MSTVQSLKEDFLRFKIEMKIEMDNVKNEHNRKSRKVYHCPIYTCLPYLHPGSRVGLIYRTCVGIPQLYTHHNYVAV